MHAEGVPAILKYVSKYITTYALGELVSLVLDTVNFDIKTVDLSTCTAPDKEILLELEEPRIVVTKVDHNSTADSPTHGELPGCCQITMDGDSSNDTRWMVVGLRKRPDGKRVIFCECNTNGRGYPCVHLMKYLLDQEVSVLSIHFLYATAIDVC